MKTCVHKGDPILCTIIFIMKAKLMWKQLTVPRTVNDVGGPN